MVNEKELGSSFDQSRFWRVINDLIWEAVVGIGKGMWSAHDKGRKQGGTYPPFSLANGVSLWCPRAPGTLNFYPFIIIFFKNNIIYIKNIIKNNIYIYYITYI